MPRRSAPGSTVIGVLCGMGAGALWGLVFLAPAVVRDFNPVDLAIGRYVSWGLISAMLVLPRWRVLRPKVSRREVAALGWLAFTGNTLYFVLLSNAVQTGGIAMTSLVIGFLPVAVTIIGSRDAGAVPLSKLLPSLLLCAAGAVCIGWQAIGGAVAEPIETRVIGLLCAVGALVSWTAFAVINQRWLRRLGEISVYEWNLLFGMMTGAQSLALVPIALALEIGGHSAGDWWQLAAVSVAIALLASIAGNALWNRMSRLLPLTLVGQMILFETLFALSYGFLWERRVPALLEATAFGLVVLSVVSCIAAHRSPASRRAIEPLNTIEG